MLGVERTGFVDEPRIGLLRVSRQLLYHFRRNLLGLLGRELFCSTCQQSREATTTSGQLREQGRPTGGQQLVQDAGLLVAIVSETTTAAEPIDRRQD